MAKVELKIVLHTSEILYEIENRTYLAARIGSSEMNPADSANMIANDDDENRNQILRSINTAFATLKTKLWENIEESGETASNKLTSADKMEVTLKVPSNYNLAAKDALTLSMHQYIINQSLAEWFLTLKHPASRDYAALAAANLEHAREAINKRTRPIRPNKQ